MGIVEWWMPEKRLSEDTLADGLGKGFSA